LPLLDAQLSAQDKSDGLIGSALVGWRCDGNLERPGLLPYERVPPRSRLSAHGQYTTLGVIADLNHLSLSSSPWNKTLPSRTKVAPSSTATSKSLLIPMDKCSRWCAGSSWQRSRSRKPRSWAKVGRQVSGSCRAAMVIRPCTRTWRSSHNMAGRE